MVPTSNIELKQSEILYSTCTTTTPPYPTSLLNTLYSNADHTNSYNATVGQNTADTVYGFFLCRGDLARDVCKDCVATANLVLVHMCPTNKEAAIWYDECMLRYSNNMTVVNRPRLFVMSTKNETDPSLFSPVLAKSMNDLVTKVIGNANYFATIEGNITDKVSAANVTTLYCLGQCPLYLSVADCSSCLQAFARDLVSMDHQGARATCPRCNIRYQLSPFFDNSKIINQSVPSPLPDQPPRRPKLPEGRSKFKFKFIGAISAALGVISLVLIALAYLVMRRRVKKKTYNAQPEETRINITIESLQFDLASIEIATNKFSSDNKLGQGGFGEVFKGTLGNGQEIAVKRLSKSSGQGVRELKNEVVLVAKLQHRNLVKLLGFCLEGEETLLVYEYVPNKSLDYFIFEQLDWSRRSTIIGGIARGILYLHEDSRLRVIHRDLKASNILLDDNMNPKISDFGMAKMFGVDDQTQGNTRRIVGTYGYMAPEYAMGGLYSVKSDVFSFRILVLEILMGRKNFLGFHPTTSALTLLNYAWELWNEGKVLELMDPLLKDSCSPNELLRYIHIGLLCVQEDANTRPTMSSVVQMLKSQSMSLSKPERPAFFTGRRSTNDHGHTLGAPIS
ncbi:hypothetical protein M0R45_025160 [Rubus argutus]|uniref:Cysteine-rich receptor-like protein kinase 10 n=1 Tax=Rubus argutus TaxID=59490 RepID=A0AAW1WUM4_RUBAR